MIVPEMVQELESLEQVREEQAKVDLLFRLRHRLGVELNYRQKLMSFLADYMDKSRDAGAGALETQLRKISYDSAQKILAELEDADRRMVQTQARILDRFNPRWGMLFKEGDEHSIFGAQVEDYADVYTSRVSNFLSYSPHQYFRGARALLPHEIDL